MFSWFWVCYFKSNIDFLGNYTATPPQKIKKAAKNRCKMIHRGVKTTFLIGNKSKIRQKGFNDIN